MGKTRKKKTRKKLAGQEKGKRKGRPRSPQFPPVLFSCLRFLNSASLTTSEPGTGYNNGVCDIFTWYRPEDYVCKLTVPFQIFNTNATNNSFQLVRRAFPSFFFSFPFFLFFFSKNTGFFFQGARGANIRLAILFKELLKNISKIYLQGRLKANAQTVCLGLGPLCSISKSPPPLPESLGALIQAGFSRT